MTKVKIISEKQVVKIMQNNWLDGINEIKKSFIQRGKDRVILPEKTSQIFDPVSQNRINCMPSSLLDENVSGVKWVSVFPTNASKNIENVMRNLLPRDLISYVLDSSKIPGDKKINQITKEEREELVKTIKNFKLIFNELDEINRAIVTSGGIDVKDIDPKTMESKLVKGLYFIGEVIDIDGLTGGFNIQIANSTGYSCGINL